MHNLDFDQGLYQSALQKLDSLEQHFPDKNRGAAKLDFFISKKGILYEITLTWTSGKFLTINREIENRIQNSRLQTYVYFRHKGLIEQLEQILTNSDDIF